MKRKFILYYILLLVLVFAACKIAGGTTTDGIHHQNKTFRLSGNVTYTSDYCGGAEPPETLLQELAKPRPYAGKKFYIRGGETNNLKSKILYTVVTDSLGNYSINLPVGNYCMIDEYRKDSTFIGALLNNTPESGLYVTDKQCVKDWFNSCFYGFKISTGDISNINFNIHRDCFRPEGIPCVAYTGPLPE